jgi:hypothetical protein
MLDEALSKTAAESGVQVMPSYVLNNTEEVHVLFSNVLLIHLMPVLFINVTYMTRFPFGQKTLLNTEFLT